MKFSWTGASSNTNRTTSPYDTTSIDRQIENAVSRIQDAGYKTQNTDRRNWFEKLTNLPQGQNFFFDTLELLDRPANAIRSAIHSKQEGGSGGDALKAAIGGVSGNERVSGSDLLQNSGIENKLAKTLLGVGVEIATDPLTFVPGGLIKNAVSIPARATGRAVKGAYEAAEKAIPKFGQFSETVLRPGAENVSRGLGYAFNPNYKKTETLTGGESDFLKNLERETENSRNFMRENYLKKLSDTVRSAGGIDTGTDVGRLMERELVSNSDRPIRGMSTSPEIVNAANKLVESNSEIREYAKQRGIDIPELAGYMTHILTQEEKARRSTGKALKLDVGRFGLGNPNKKILSKRKYEGSVEDINEQAGRNVFNPNAFFATGVGQQRLIDYIHAVDFRRKVMSNADFAQKYEKGMDIGKNVIVDTNNYKFLKEVDDALENAGLADEIGGEYVVTPQVKMLLDRYQKMNSDEGTKAFIKALDALQGTWKKLALFSPGFHIRNMAGGLWNNYVTGMSLPQIIRYTQQSVGEVTNAIRGKESEMFKEYRAQGLGSTGLSQVEYGSLKEPEKGIQKTIEQRSKGTRRQVLQRANPLNAFQTSREVGDVMDQTNRFAVYKWARDKGMTPKQAAEKVRETQFDYTNLTPFEQGVRRVLPFYAWMRNNIPFQVKKFVEDPRKFQNINRVRLNAQENVGLDEENIPTFMKESFSIPVSGEDGKGKMLGLNLPLSDLTKLSNPLKLGADALTPLLKTPLELATNFNFFRQKPIEQFAGQEQQYDIPGVGTVGVPIKTGYTIEQLGGQIGRGLSDYLQPPETEDQENKFRTPSFGISNMLKPFDADANKYFERLAYLKQLQDLMRYIEQQTGEKPRTVSEIKKGTQ